MNPITQTIKEREKVFNDFLVINEMYIRGFPVGKLEAHNTQTNTALLESVVRVVKKMENNELKGHEQQMYDSALQAILTELQEALKELKK